jgi:cysteine-rich repeat protein
MRMTPTIRRGGFRLAPLAAATLLLVVGPATATFHLMSIVQVFGGTPASPQAQYIVLQMYSAGQNLVGGHDVLLYNSAGTQIASRVFAGNVGNGANQARILIATPQAETFFNVQANLEIPASILADGGKACFSDGIDCVSWGSYRGSTAGVGTAFNANGGLPGGRAAVRRLDISGGTTTLNALDDTDNSANDFRLGSPAPRNNAGTLGVAPASTCGNGSITGLEQCDDGNALNGDRCNSVCSATLFEPRADFNNDRRSDVAWRNNTTGMNMIWRSANSATPQAVTSLTNLAWRVVGIGDFDNSNTADLLWRNTSTGANVIWRAANSATQSAVASQTTAWTVGGVGDFSGDGRDDILWRNGSTGANVIWRSGSAAATTAVTTIATQWRVGGVGDFDADGRADILWRNASTGANTIWRRGSSATVMSVATLATTWSVAGIGDFNGDRRADILWRSTTGANMTWRGGTSNSAFTLTTLATAWRVAAVADYNLDGRDDILWRNATTGANTIWRSGSSATPQAVATLASQAWQVVR